MAGYRPENGRASGGPARPPLAGARSHESGYRAGSNGYRWPDRPAGDGGWTHGDHGAARGRAGHADRWPDQEAGSEPTIRLSRDGREGRHSGPDGRDRGYWDDSGRTGEGAPGRSRRRRDPTGGAEGNERLTALTGAVLLVLFAAEGVTILAVHQLMTLHFFIGMLLAGPVMLKVGSTFFRFTRYYTGVAEYRRKGPPAPLLRLLGPFVVMLSLGVIGSGVMLAVEGPAHAGVWMLAHKGFFVLWFGAMTIHVLAYVWRLPQLIRGDVVASAGRRAGQVLGGRPARLLLLTASVLTGLVLALLTVHQAGAWSGFVGG